MLCERCGEHEATGVIVVASRSEDGTETRREERLCGPCWDAWHAAGAARQAEVDARVRAAARDGSLFAHLRAQLAGPLRGAGPAERAQAAEFLDLIGAHLDVPLPADLRAFADEHRRLAT